MGWRRCAGIHQLVLTSVGWVERNDTHRQSRHVDYIHMNPVKHGLVKRVVDWPHSSFHRYVKAGILPIDWAGDIAFADVDYGE